MQSTLDKFITDQIDKVPMQGRYIMHGGAMVYTGKALRDGSICKVNIDGYTIVTYYTADLYNILVFFKGEYLPDFSFSSPKIRRIREKQAMYFDMFRKVY